MKSSGGGGLSQFAHDHGCVCGAGQAECQLQCNLLPCTHFLIYTSSDTSFNFKFSFHQTPFRPSQGYHSGTISTDLFLVHVYKIPACHTAERVATMHGAAAYSWPQPVTWKATEQCAQADVSYQPPVWQQSSVSSSLVCRHSLNWGEGTSTGYLNKMLSEQLIMAN